MPLLRPIHTAEKHRPTMFHAATVRLKRSGPSILYNTPLNKANLISCHYKIKVYLLYIITIYSITINRVQFTIIITIR